MTPGTLLPRSEAAERLNVSQSTVVRLGRAGAITQIRVGKRASPQEGWSVLKGVLANLAVASFAHLVQVIPYGLRVAGTSSQHPVAARPRVVDCEFDL